MNILVIGAGGREHAFTWKIKQSMQCDHIYVAPGNAGTAQIAINLPIGVNDFAKLAEAVIQYAIDLIVVGPEEPLVNGIRNYFKSHPTLHKVLLVGPDQMGAKLEGSKEFSKDFMNKYGIPTAQSKTITIDNIYEGFDLLDTLKPPYVLKADGLAAGKGVIICHDLSEAKSALQTMLDGQFGAASDKVLIEEYLDGIELSVFVLTDGKDYLILPEAKDYKRIGDGDTGPNTGGMGAISPVIFADASFMDKVTQRVVKPTINGFNAEGFDYKGFVFIGLMNIKGEPYVIEYNVRMGDPETQVVLPRIQSDFLQLLIATAKGQLGNESIDISNQTATTVVAVAGGYPGSYDNGKVITGLTQFQNGMVFHAGTKNGDQDQIQTNGGRVITSTGLGQSIQEALDISYENLSQVSWEGMYYRKDIGQDLIRLAIS